MASSTRDNLVNLAGPRQSISLIVDNVLSEVVDQEKMEPQFLTDMEFFKRVLATKPPFKPGEESASQVEYSVC